MSRSYYDRPGVPVADASRVADPIPPAPTHDPSGSVLDELRSWWCRYVRTIDDRDHDLLTVWTAHTHLVGTFYTTPRLTLDSPLPESGKTTVLEHLSHLAADPIQVAGLTSPAQVARMLADRPRTILLDEVEKTLRPDRDGVGDLLAVINTGYKRGASRPVLVPDKDSGGWTTKEMPTFSAVAMAGLSPDLPDDTRSRMLTVQLLPDFGGTVSDSDWEFIEQDAWELRDLLAAWTAHHQPSIEFNPQPPLPDGTTGRMKEKWRPLKRIAIAAGGRWPDAIDELIVREMDERRHDMDERLLTERTAVTLLRDLAAVWPDDETHVRTVDLIAWLQARNPSAWLEHDYGPLTAQKMGRWLAHGFKIRTQKLNDQRGYFRSDLERAWRSLGIE
jgi:hypothetical protein